MIKQLSHLLFDILNSFYNDQGDVGVKKVMRLVIQKLALLLVIQKLIQKLALMLVTQKLTQRLTLLLVSQKLALRLLKITNCTIQNLMVKNTNKKPIKKKRNQQQWRNNKKI